MNDRLKLAIAAGLIAAFGLAACQKSEQENTTTAAEPVASAPAEAAVTAEEVPLGSGIEMSGFDTSVRPQDDFFDYVNGKWVAETALPADRARWGTFDALREKSQEDVRALIEEVSAIENVEPGSATQKIRDFYNAYMDTGAATELGVEAIRAELDEIASIESYDDLFRAFATLGVYGVNGPIGGGIFSDLKDPDTNVVYLVESGITLPDRDYYLLDDEQFVEGRELLNTYIASLFELAGMEGGADKAQAIQEVEHALAKVHWTKEENRDPVKSYNPKTPDELQQLAPNINWEVTFEAGQIPARDRYIVSQPSFFEAASGIIADTSLDTWKDYLTYQTIDAFAPVLGDQFFRAWFEFYRAGLQGIDEPRPQWKRAVNSVNGNMGELLGQLYVDRHYQEESRARMETMIANLKEAYRQSILALDWMGEETKQQALDKLSKFNPKIGYPENWRDYSSMEITEGDLVSNVKSAADFEYRRNLDKLDRPVDKNEWFMNPQTVNAYYNPAWNEIVFPAAILQPPFFNVEADDAVNYGGIGAVIGHEIGHGFDDQGRKFDGDGNLRDWWTEEDNSRFEVRKNMLAEQYNGYEVIDGLTINGEFTSGENIGDLGGLGIAYKAYKLSLDGEEAPVIDGFTGDQRFFIGWAQVWRGKARDAETKRLLTVDPHSPAKFRANGAPVNVNAFYDAFDVKEGDGMYLPPEERVKIW
ncbi:MAG: peptidase M13 [Xanthomonadales bacterium]|nr:peptidase M13 [Gammaproteobacteria bacterium]MBT8052402.1 peptidase M13 [Gammaproteobacteria bacterium]NND55713.1 peptidase M13 [Xanthomonadales bacterium]NNK52273.1 peptidase M13 [Xanthomonadales bacterium]